MNPKIKQIGKKIIFPILRRMDVLTPRLTTRIIRRFYRYDSLNDLRIPQSYHYDPLGTYVTFHSRRPAFYRHFLATYVRDGDGLPLYVYEGKQDYQIVLLAQFGLMEYGYYLDTHEEIHRRNCLASADKLLELQDEHGGWPCFFTYPHPRVNSVLRAGWYTAMGQGQAISLFVRANALEPKEAYQSAAHRALEVLGQPVDDGGVCTKLGDLDFYEEYPTVPSSYTLNGLIFCMIGLYDGGQNFQDEKAESMFRHMLHTVKKILPLYDDETITCYDLSHITNPPREKFRSRKYHILHVELLQALHDIAPDEVFEYYIKKWMRR